MKGQIGQEETSQDYILKLTEVGKELFRVLKNTGSMWFNIGDSYYNKELLLIPSRLALAYRELGFILRNKIVWYKTNHMPESVKDRFTRTYEPLFFFTKTKNYYFDLDGVRVKHKTKARWGKNITYSDLPNPHTGLALTKHDKAVDRTNRSYTDSLHKRDYHPLGKNPGDLWQIPTKPYKGAHFAVFPETLCYNPIIAGSPKFGLVLDPFLGSGTTMVVSKKYSRSCIGIELNPEYIGLVKERMNWKLQTLDSIDYIETRIPATKKKRSNKFK
jgi:site-specific DNA-methyltransferase (adenine-specific)